MKTITINTFKNELEKISFWGGLINIGFGISGIAGAAKKAKNISIRPTPFGQLSSSVNSGISQIQRS